MNRININNISVAKCLVFVSGGMSHLLNMQENNLKNDYVGKRHYHDVTMI